MRPNNFIMLLLFCHWSVFNDQQTALGKLAQLNSDAHFFKVFLIHEIKTFQKLIFLLISSQPSVEANIPEFIQGTSQPYILILSSVS